MSSKTSFLRCPKEVPRKVNVQATDIIWPRSSFFFVCVWSHFVLPSLGLPKEEGGIWRVRFSETPKARWRESVAKWQRRRTRGQLLAGYLSGT